MSETIKEINELILNKNIKGKIEFNYNLSKLSWFGVSGDAEVFFVPESVKELSVTLRSLSPNIKRTIIGLGSNILVRDGGLDGIVIKLGKQFSDIDLDDGVIKVGASVPDRVLSRFCCSELISGFEFLFGIPGNIGGAIAMNAGCYGSEIKDIFVSADCIDHFGNSITINASENLFSYRNSSRINNLIVINVLFRVNKNDEAQIRNKMEQINKDRVLTQPQKIRTAGSTFKNPISSLSNKKAWELIEISGSRNIKLKNISLSDKHANFIVNKQFKSANQIEQFGEIIKKRVLEETGISLEWEIKILGNP